MAKSDKKDKKAKGGKKKGKRGDGSVLTPSVAGHPRAAAQVRRAKGFGGVLFFFLTAYYSRKAGVTFDHLALRALMGGIAGYLLFWACSVTVWRQMVMAEFRAAVENGRATLAPVEAGAAEGAPEATP